MGELCGKGRSSKVKCMDSQSNARFCIFENTMLDFSKMTDIKRPGLPDSRKWEKGFLATDCDQQAHPNIDYYEVNIAQFLFTIFVHIFYCVSFLLVLRSCR